MMQGHILVVDDEASMRGYLRTVLEISGYRVDDAASGSEAVSRVQDYSPDVILLDLLMPEMDGIAALAEIRKLRPQAKVIMLSCCSDTHAVVEAMRLGAIDYLTKPFQKEELESTLQRWLADIESNREPLAGEIEKISDDCWFVAASPIMRAIRMQAAQVSRVDVPVLVLGESGTGKEVIARIIHHSSPRAHRPWLKVNCAAVPEDLLESELFGYEPGAFTGAMRAKPGKFELCNHGTILLDEIAEMTPALQAKLLQVLQDQRFSRLGGRATIEVDVRVIAATNVDVVTALADGRLRSDLYYRLNAFTISLPPLRDRKQDIPLLLKHLMGQMAEQYGRAPLSYSGDFVNTCMRYAWPGNVRELENIVKRYLVLGDERVILQELASREPPETRAPGGDISKGLKPMMRHIKDDAEAAAIERALRQAGGSRKQAALMLNISYKALLYKVRQYGINVPAGRRSKGMPAA